MISETLTIRGELDIKLFNEDGSLKDHRIQHNAIKAAGLYGLLDQNIASPTLAKVGWMAIGTGTPAATLLGTEIGRNALTSKARSDAVLTMVGDWAAGEGTGTITEAGLFDVVTDNTINMWCSSSFVGIVKGAGDALQIIWKITIS